MKLKFIKAILMIAFIVLTASLTYIGLNKKEASIDFNALNKERTAEVNTQSEAAFANILKNIGNSTSVVKADVLESTDTSRLSLSIRLLDTMKQYVYAAVLSERLADLQHSSYRYHMAARYFLLATEEKENKLMLFRKAKIDLEKCIELKPNNLDAKVDLAVSIYNINNIQKPESNLEFMKPIMLLREVVTADPNHVDGLYYLGKLAIEGGKLDLAIERFKKLVSLQPQNQEFYLELSRIYTMQGDKEEAKAWEDKARAIK